MSGHPPVGPGMARMSTKELVNDEIAEIDGDESPVKLNLQIPIATTPDGVPTFDIGKDQEIKVINNIAELPLDLEQYGKKGSSITIESVAHRGTNYTTTFRDSIGMMSGSPSERETMNLSVLGRDMNMTNYQSALEWGRTTREFGNPVSYHKTSKNPLIHYETSRATPIVIKEGPKNVDRADLPLV